ncbi:MAG TPA: hypothetical protein VNT31_13095 [Nocardioides sp.]|nr:hypothetical protein [Nocardioides sp.]
MNSTPDACGASICCTSTGTDPDARRPIRAAYAVTPAAWSDVATRATASGTASAETSRQVCS